VGARDGWLDLLKVPVDKRSDSVLTKTTLAILSGVTLIATQLKELAFIMSLAGATLGNALIYVYPALMFRSAVKNMGEKASKGLKREVPFAMFSASLGVVMGWKVRVSIVLSFECFVRYEVFVIYGYFI